MPHRLALLASSALLPLLVASCIGTRDAPRAAYDPCRMMHREARTVDSLDRQMESLSREARRSPAQAGTAEAAADSARRVTAESLLVHIQEIRTLYINNMQQSARACEAKVRPDSRYQTGPEREDRR
jgi:hypothetical protein